MEDQKQEREFIGAKEACELLGYKTYATLRKHIERGAIKGFKSPINGHYYVSRKHIEEILQGKYQKQEREFIGVKEACELLGYKSYFTLRKHIERGAINGFKNPINGHYYVSRKHIEEILQGKFN